MKIDPHFNDDITHDNEGLNEDDLKNIRYDPTNNDIPILNAKTVLHGLLNQVSKIDFKALADMAESGTLKNNHLQIIVTEQILKLARENHWNLCKNGDTIFVFNAKFWECTEEDDFITFLGEAAERMGVDPFKAKFYAFRDQLNKQFHTLAAMPFREFKSETVLINLQNGTFEVTINGGRMKDFDQADFLTYQLPFSYDPDAQAEIFNSFLMKVLPDEEKQKLLAEYLAYLFIKHAALKLEKTLLLFGNGANGKSVFFDIVNALLGPKNVTNFGLHQLTTESGYHRAMIANKLVNYSSEISNKLEADMFKKLSSGEPVEARSPYGKPYTITQYAKLIFNCNELPKDVENTRAFFRRFLIIHFDVTIPEEEQDKELAKKIIKNELSGVFNWVLQGLERLLTNKSFTYSHSVSQLIRQYEHESDSVKMFLEEDGYEVDNHVQKPFKILYDEYTDFCTASKFIALNKKNFKNRLLNYGLGIAVKKINTGYVVNLVRKITEI